MSREIADNIIQAIDRGAAMVGLPMNEQVAMRAMARRLAGMAATGAQPEDWLQLASCAEWALQRRPAPAKPLTVNGQWIEWHGGECPVEPETRVEVRFTDDYELGEPMSAACWNWEHSNRWSSIIAYRIVD